MTRGLKSEKSAGKDESIANIRAGKIFFTR